MRSADTLYSSDSEFSSQPIMHSDAEAGIKNVTWAACGCGSRAGPGAAVVCCDKLLGEEGRLACSGNRVDVRHCRRAEDRVVYSTGIDIEPFTKRCQQKVCADAA